MEDDPGGGLDELFGTADGEGRVCRDRSLDADQAFADGRWVREVGQCPLGQWQLLPVSRFGDAKLSVS